MVHYRVLGPVEVAEDGTSADLGPPKQRALLAILLLNANEVVPVDRLIDLLWPEGPPRRAAHAIQVYVSELRAALEPLAGRDVITWQPPGYELRIEPGALDADVVERLTSEGLQQLAAGDLRAADVTLGHARELWRGPPLSDFIYEEFAQDGIRHLTDVWLQGTQALAEVKLGVGDEPTALSLAQAAIREDPLCERPREVEMLSLYRLGRAADALRAYERYRRCLADELGAQPSPRLQRLHEAILIHDPSLESGHGRRVGGPSSARSPYKGLRAFTEADALDFHGRDALVRRLLDALAGGCRLVTLVGPSGSGKSSVLSAGLIPALRAAAVQGSDRWIIARLHPGPHPLEALRAARMDAIAGSELLLVMDQAEEAFQSGDETERDQFLEALTRAASDEAGGIRVVLALRADAYDLPLQHAGFAEVFLAGIVHVLPMTAAELEAAVVEPGRRVGVGVDPALLAELVSDTIHRPGALPLLQHVLAELFDRRTDAGLSLAAYRDLGGLRGALSNRAESAFMSLDDQQQRTARQVLLRLVRLGEGQRVTARRVPVRELTELAIDSVDLSRVLRDLEASRLITFDRDPIAGLATVEVAHEMLLSAWDRVAAWIDHARADLQRHEALATRVEEWEASGRHAEDLLGGSRLDEYQAWVGATSLGLTIRELAYVDASRAQRRTQEAAREAQRVYEHRLERRARTRLLGFVGASAVLVAAFAYGALAWPGRAADVALVYPGPGDGGMYDRIGDGFREAVDRLGLDAETVIERPAALRERLDRLAEQGVHLIVVAQAWSNPDVEVVAADHGDTRFLATDYWGELPNVAAAKFAGEEGAFLVGAAAALTSTSGTVAVIVDSDSNIDWPAAGGFQAGAHAARADVDVRIAYLTRGPQFDDVTFVMVNRAAHELYGAGADVVFYAGPSAPLAVFEAAYTESETQARQLWAIGIDSDWYVALPFAGPRQGRDSAAWRSHVLTSLITRYDDGIAAMLGDYARGTLASGNHRFGLAVGAFELAASGGHLDAIRPVLDAFRDRIIAGEILVPRYPADRGPPR